MSDPETPTPATAPATGPVSATEPAPAAPSAIPSNEERLMALCAHLAGPFIPLIVAIVIWVAKRDTSPFVDAQGKEAINFQITLLLATAAATALGVVTCGMTTVVLPVLWVANLVLSIVAGLKAYEGKPYRYSVNWRFIT